MRIIFWASKTPHVLIIRILGSAFTGALLLGSCKSTPWLAYILFLIFLGGILILFSYVSRLRTSLLFSKINIKHLLAFTPIIILFVYLFMQLPIKPDIVFDLSSFSIEIFVKNILTPLISPVYLYLFIYLLITLVYVVSIIKIYSAPLRTINS